MGTHTPKEDIPGLHRELMDIVREIADSTENEADLLRLSPDFPLQGEGQSLALDSLDILELALRVEKRFDIRFPDDVDPAVFATVASLAEYVRSSS
jgi:acyl carrier protein